MDLTFNRGSREEPKGHALLFFKNPSDAQQVWATYMVILPITVDVSKYVPPFLMNQVGELGPKDLSAFAFPPTPEQVESYAVLEELARQRDDDVVFGGDIDPNDAAQGMMMINEAVQEYAEIYGRYAPAIGEPDDEQDDEDEGADVKDVIYELMSEGDKLEELTKMVGRLRFAVEGSDTRQVEEAERDIRLLARHFPENHNISSLVRAAKADDRRGAELADLYLRRCYFLVHEEYARLADVERRLTELEDGPPAG